MLAKRAVVFLLSLIFITNVFAQAISESLVADGITGAAQGSYNSMVSLFPQNQSTSTTLEYSFSNNDDWQKFDRPLYLDAFSGESRFYSINFRNPNTSQHFVLEYTIDKKAPACPSFSQASGDVGSLLELTIDSPSKIFYSINGQDFIEYDKSVLSFNSLKNETSIVNIKAYAVDECGNYSSVNKACYRLFPEGMSPAFPFSDETTKTEIVHSIPTSRISASIADMTGSAMLKVNVPNETFPFIAVGSKDDVFDLESYVQVSSSSQASVSINYPWGYQKEIVISCGYYSNGKIIIENENLSFVPQFPKDEYVDILPSAFKPELVQSDGVATVFWHNCPWPIYYSVDDSSFSPYSGPISIKQNEKPISIRFYSVGSNGMRSDTDLITIPALKKLVKPVVLGIENNAVYGTEVCIVPENSNNILYEISSNGDFAKAPDANSKLIPKEGLVVSGISGKVVDYSLRCVTKPIDNEICLEKIYTFSIDKEAPEVPKIASGNSNYYATDTVVEFENNSGDIYYSISTSEEAEFKKYDRPVTIKGSLDGRVNYIVRAYSVDDFGNRSNEMEKVNILIDSSSLYVDNSGRDIAIGSPDDPIKNLDDAIEKALKDGKNHIYIRGDAYIHRAIHIDGKLNITGGFDQSWQSKALTHIYIDSIDTVLSEYEVPNLYKSAITIENGELNIKDCSISIKDNDSAGFIYSRKSSVSFCNVNIDISSNLESFLSISTDSNICFASTSISFLSSSTVRAIDMTSGKLKIEGLSICAGDDVRMASCIKLDKTEANISELLLNLSPSYAFTGINAKSSNLLLEKSIFVIGGGASSSRMINASNSDIKMFSNYFDINWNGTTQLLYAEEESNVDLVFVTTMLNSKNSTFVSSLNSEVTVFNSIVSSDLDNVVLFSSDKEIKNDQIAKNCLYGINCFCKGSSNINSIQDLNKYVTEGMENFIEDSKVTFVTRSKGLRRISKKSKCINNGIFIPWAEYDLFGKQRNKSKVDMPDIGAEEQ